LPARSRLFSGATPRITDATDESAVLKGKAVSSDKIAEGKISRVKHSSKKLEDCCIRVRKMFVTDALEQLKYDPTKAAKVLTQAILRARGQALHHHTLKGSKLRIHRLWVSKEKTQTRFYPGARSRLRPRIIRWHRVHCQLVEAERPPSKRVVRLLNEAKKDAERVKQIRAMPAGKRKNIITKRLDVRLTADGSIKSAAYPRTVPKRLIGSL
jgi:ribosomal protein L22